MARMDPKKAATLATTGVTLAVKYGPQLKLAWDKGGKQAAQAAARRAGLVRAKRQAHAHAAGLVDASVLQLAPGGDTVYVVLSGATPVAAYPPVATPLAELVAHADLTRAVPPEKPRSLRRGGS
ncbi:MAG: hypothetical protein PIR53_12005 [Nocardioides alkalitolerans]